METNSTESLFDTTHIPTDAVLIALISQIAANEPLDPELERPDAEIRVDHASVFGDFYQYFEEGHNEGDEPCMCEDCMADILESLQSLYTYIVSPLCSDHAVSIFPTTIYAHTQDTYQDLIIQIIDNIRELEAPSLLQSKMVRKLNKLLAACDVPYLDNVESGHDSDWDEQSEWEADESDDSIADL